MPAREQNLYQRLGVTPAATPEQLKGAYRERLLATHPALHPEADADDFRFVKAAYEVLANPAERRRYDLLTGLGAPGGQPAVWRRSYRQVLAGLSAGLRPTVMRLDELIEQASVARRRAG